MAIVTPKSFGAPAPAAQPAQQPAPVPQAARQPDTTEASAAPQEAMSPKWAALARREKQMLALDRQIKEREQKVAEREKSYETSYVPKERLTKETLNVLREAGITDNQLAEMLLAGEQKQDPTAFVKDELAQIRKELKDAEEKTQNELKTRDQKQREQAVAQIRTQAQALVDGSEDYQTIKDSGSTEAIVKFIERTFDEDGVIMDVEDAAKFIEEQLISAAMEPTRYKKVQEKLRAEFAPQPTQAPQKLVAPQPKSQPMQTLTNRQAQSPSGALTAKDRVNRAIMRAQGLDPDAVG